MVPYSFPIILFVLFALVLIRAAMEINKLQKSVIKHKSDKASLERSLEKNAARYVEVLKRADEAERLLFEAKEEVEAILEEIENDLLPLDANSLEDMPEHIRLELAETLKKVRAECGLSVNKAGEVCGISRHIFAKLEGGHAVGYPAILMHFAIKKLQKHLPDNLKAIPE